ncbi:MAG: ATP synthase F1 subunit delta [Deltaproteobacteria bacterium]|nr:ATP synthase F1 subunit delta [Deltaproteobacteria bacterium]
MTAGKISRRYARAIFELAAGREEAVAAEIDGFLKVYAHPELRHVLGNPAFDVERRKQIVAELAGRMGLSDLTTHFVLLLLTRERMDGLASIASHYHSLLDEARGRVNAKVLVSQPLADEQRESLGSVVSGMTGKTAVLTEELDLSILGGIIVEVGGKVYDGSVRTQLHSLRQNIERTY